jgi:hypothetical protein
MFFRFKRPNRLLYACALHHRVQVADAAVGEDDQVAVPVDASVFDEPRLARPFVGGAGLVVEGCGEVIDPRCVRTRVIRITEAGLICWANPGLAASAERLEGGDPSIGIILGWLSRGNGADLWPDVIVLLQIKIRGDREVFQIGGALGALRSLPHVRNEGHRQDGEDADYRDDDDQFEEGKAAAATWLRLHTVATAALPASASRRGIGLFISGNGQGQNADNDRVAIGCHLAF